MCTALDFGMDFLDLYQFIEIDEECACCGGSPVLVLSVASGYREPGDVRDGDTVICPNCSEEGYIVASPDGSYVEWFCLIGRDW